jgi:hypothetical protein
LPPGHHAKKKNCSRANVKIEPHDKYLRGTPEEVCLE